MDGENESGGALARLREAGLDPDAADAATIGAAEAKLRTLIETRVRPHAHPLAAPAFVPVLTDGARGGTAGR